MEREMSQRSEIVALQYLRGLCAVAVVIDHAAGMLSFHKYFGIVLLGGILEQGRLGVDVFFVISGFIITVVALKDKDAAPALSRGSFFAKRFARIVPLMWISIISYLLLRATSTDTKILPMNYFRALVLWPSGELEPKNIWTLRHEYLFYVVFAFSLLGRRRWRWLIVAWALASVLFAFIKGTFWAALPDRTFPAILFSSVNLEFGAGMLVGLAVLRRSNMPSIDLPIHPFFAFAFFAFVLIAISAVSHLNWQSVPGSGLTALMAAALVALATKVRCPPDQISSFGRLLGNSSYSIYLFHPAIVSALLSVLARVLHHKHGEWAFLFVVTMTLGVGIVIHRALEQPLVLRVQHWLRPRPEMLPVVVRAP